MRPGPARPAVTRHRLRRGWEGEPPSPTPAVGRAGPGQGRPGRVDERVSPCRFHSSWRCDPTAARLPSQCERAGASRPRAACASRDTVLGWGIGRGGVHGSMSARARVLLVRVVVWCACAWVCARVRAVVCVWCARMSACVRARVRVHVRVRACVRSRAWRACVCACVACTLVHV